MQKELIKFILRVALKHTTDVKMVEELLSVSSTSFYRLRRMEQPECDEATPEQLMEAAKSLLRRVKKLKKCECRIPWALGLTKEMFEQAKAQVEASNDHQDLPDDEELLGDLFAVEGDKFDDDKDSQDEERMTESSRGSSGAAVVSSEGVEYASESTETEVEAGASCSTHSTKTSDKARDNIATVKRPAQTHSADCRLVKVRRIEEEQQLRQEQQRLEEEQQLHQEQQRLEEEQQLHQEQQRLEVRQLRLEKEQLERRMQELEDRFEQQQGELRRQKSLAERTVFGLSIVRRSRKGCKEGSERFCQLFDDLKDSTNSVAVDPLMKYFEESGLRRSDPRVSEFFEHIMREGGHLSKPEFLHAFESLGEEHILKRTLHNELVIADFPAFRRGIESTFEACNSITDGQVAQYIPELANVDESNWACSVCTIDGQCISLGKSKEKFTLQSTSKPFAYGLVLHELGDKVVHHYVGQEPSGRDFNDICLDQKNRPFNAMVNAGAIMVSALLSTLMRPDLAADDKFDFVKQYFERLSGGHSLHLNREVYESEKGAAHRNYALAHFMADSKSFPKNSVMDDFLDLYFKMCSIEVDTDSLAAMGATLANGGVCPTSQEAVLLPKNVRNVLSLMYSCGLYNGSGQFSFEIGIPAKSGVSGTLLLVVPNVMSVALWSPKLDPKGNSVRGLEFAEQLVRHFHLHLFDNLRFPPRHLKQDPANLQMSLERKKD